MVNTRGAFRPSQTSTMEIFCKKQLAAYWLTIFLKRFIVDARLDSKYPFEYNKKFFPDISQIKLMTF